MEISANPSVTPAPAPKPVFETLESVLRKIAAPAPEKPTASAEAPAPRGLRKGQTLDIRV